VSIARVALLNPWRLLLQVGDGGRLEVVCDVEGWGVCDGAMEISTLMG